MTRTDPPRKIMEVKNWIGRLDLNTEPRNQKLTQINGCDHVVSKFIVVSPVNHNLDLFSIHESWIPPLIYIPPLYILSSSVDVAYILKVHVIFNPLSIILVSEPLILIF